jgi:L-iditol 2-dehydrogenase
MPLNPPVTIGHEFSGEVVETGEDVEEVSIGDRVTSETAFEICGQCRFCRGGDYHLCIRRKTLGYWHNGGFAECVAVPARLVHHIPDHVDFRFAALSEPLAVGVHSVLERAHPEAGDLIVVSGPGTIGLLIAGIAKLSGCRVVVLGIHRDRYRLDVASRLGIDLTVDIEQEDPLQIIMEMSGGLGADSVFECSGAQSSSGLCLELLRKRGRYMAVGLFGRSIPLDFDRVVLSEIEVLGSFSYTWSTWERAIDLLATGGLPLDEIITDVLPLDSWEEGFKRVEGGQGVKILLAPGGLDQT